MTDDESYSEVLRSIRVTSPRPRLTVLETEQSFAGKVSDRLGFTGLLNVRESPAVMGVTATRPLGLFQPLPVWSHESDSATYRPVTLSFAEFEHDSREENQPPGQQLSTSSGSSDDGRTDRDTTTLTIV